MCAFFQLWSFENYTSKSRPHLRHKISCSFSPSTSPHLLHLQALIHGFLWWWACSWLIFSLKWCLQSPFPLLHSAAIDLQEAKDSIDEKNPRPTSSTLSYITPSTCIFPHKKLRVLADKVYTISDVALCGACRSRIFFINGVLCFLKINGRRMEKEERWLEMPLQGKDESRRRSPP